MRRVTAAALAKVITGHRYSYANEAGLQAAIAAVLTQAGHQVRREVPLNDRDRIDLAVGPEAGPWIGVEVKLAGSPVVVARQLQRYAHHPNIAALLLITRRPAHRELPAELGGKPVTVVVLGSLI